MSLSGIWLKTRSKAYGPSPREWTKSLPQLKLVWSHAPRRSPVRTNLYLFGSIYWKTSLEVGTPFQTILPYTFQPGSSLCPLAVPARNLKFPASVQFFWGTHWLVVIWNSGLFTSIANPQSRTYRGNEQAQSSDRHGEDAPTSGSCPAPSGRPMRHLIELKFTVLKVCASRWFGPRRRRELFVCQESVDRSTKTATRGRGPVTGTA